MQKIIKYLLLFILIIPTMVFAESLNFEPIYDLDTEIQDDCVYLMLSYEGDTIETINFKLSYKTSSIDLSSIQALNGYNIIKKEKSIKGKYTIIDLSFENDFITNNNNYAILEFKVDKTKYSDLFFYEIDGVNIKSKFRNNGNILSLRKDADLIIYTKKDISSSTKMQYFFIDNMYLLIIGFLGLLILLIVLINLPKKKIEEKENIINNDDIDTSFYNKDI